MSVSQKVALMMLRRLAMRRTLSRSGVEVLQALEAKAYDIVFLDVQMPEMDGYEAARRCPCEMGGNEAGRPRMVAMTGNAMQGIGSVLGGGHGRLYFKARARRGVDGRGSSVGASVPSRR
jgi:CheY-like chemotaxis protein